MANWPGRRSLSLPWPIKHEHESLRAPFPRLCTLHLPLVSACTAARETRRRAIAGHPALPDAGEQSLGILASSLASRSAAQEPDAWSPSFPAGPSRGRSAAAVFYLRSPTSISATTTSPPLFASP
jgi:hypothetical protein